MNEQMKHDLAQGGLKFGIGFFATVSAFAVPKLFAAISLWNAEILRSFLDWRGDPDTRLLLIGVLLISVLVGAIVAIIQWDEQRKAADIFFTALTIPALIGGGVSTTVEHSQGLQNVRSAAEMLQRVPQVRESLELIPLTLPEPSGQRPTSFLNWLVPQAFAQEGEGSGGFISRLEPGVLIVLAQTNSAATAVEQALKLGKRLREQVGLVRQGSNYLVIYGTGTLPREDAIKKAQALQAEGASSPKLYLVK